MGTSTDIEKTNLEAHVGLCSERFDNLREKLTDLDERSRTMEGTLNDIKTLIGNMTDHRNNQLISWGASVIAVLISAVGVLAYHILNNTTTLHK